MTAPFYLLLALVGIEYIGLYHYLPIIRSLHLATVLALGLTLYVIIKNGLKPAFEYKQTKLLLTFIAFTGVTILYAFIQINAFVELKYHVGHFCLFISIFYLLSDHKKLHQFIVFFVIVHLFIVIINLNKFGLAERSGAFNAGYFLGDGNDLAWSMVITLPLTLYIFYSYNKIIGKSFGIIAFLLILFGIMGTESRGAFLALSAVLLYLIIYSKKKVPIILLVLATFVFAIKYSPENYQQRISSIGNYRQDSSASSRIDAWRSAAQMAIDHPMGVGAGNFSSMFGRFYRDRFVDPTRWGSSRWMSSHSIYFSILAEYGALGVVLLLMILYCNYRDLRQIRHHVLENKTGTNSPENLYMFLNMSLIGYAIGGAFLGGIDYPHLYVISALVISAKHITHKEEENIQGKRTRGLDKIETNPR